MAEETKQGLSSEELESQTGEALPEREAMSIISPDPGTGIHNLELEPTSTEPVEPIKEPPYQIDN